jgi:hypothetical protein
MKCESCCQSSGGIRPLIAPNLARAGEAVKAEGGRQEAMWRVTALGLTLMLRCLQPTCVSIAQVDVHPRAPTEKMIQKEQTHPIEQSILTETG